MMKKETRRLAQALLWILTGLILFLLLLQTAVVGLFTLRGNICLAVYTGSMTPTLSVGDLVVIRPTAEGDLETGQIAAFRSAENPEKSFTHRIQLVDRANGLVYTKGDGNNAPDPEPTPLADCLGVVEYAFPLFGFVYMFAHSPAGLVAVGLLLALWISFEAEGYMRKRKEKAPCEKG